MAKRMKEGYRMKNYFDLTGKTALITGASSGLGKQFAKALVNQGAAVILVARRKDRLDALVKEIQDEGGEAIDIVCDVSNEENIIQTVKEAKAWKGHIDILVNNAGVAVNANAETQTTEEWTHVIDINLTSCYIMAREVGKVMIEQKYGKIINLGSIHSNTVVNAAVEQITSYCASKGGIQMLTKALAAEWAKYNITVNALAPAYFPSEMTQGVLGNDSFTQFISMRCPMGRMGKDGELDGALIYFASDASSYTTGQTLNIDGGWNCI